MRNNRPPSEGKKKRSLSACARIWLVVLLFTVQLPRPPSFTSGQHFSFSQIILNARHFFLLCSLLNSTAHFLLHYYRLFFLFSLLRREMILNLEVRTQRFTYLHLNMSVCDFFVHSLKGISHRDIGFLRKIYILFLKISNVPSYHLVVGI